MGDDSDERTDVSLGEPAHDEIGDDTSATQSDDTRSDSDDEIVLPWWQHPINILTITVTVAVLAAMIGWMVGDSGSEVQHSEVDTGFLQDMREHHDQAVYMGFVYRSLAEIDPGLNTVAGSIIRGQDIDIGRMIQMLRLFGEAEANEGDTSMAWMGMPTERGAMPGMASEEELDRLATLSGDEADQLFVELMRDHHLGGIHMAEYAAEHADNDEVRRMAAAMATSQADEIAEMERELAN